MQVGEAYQAIGMLPEAVKFYEKVKILDSEKMYRDRIFLNLGKIHLKEKNFDEAILVGRSFIKNFPRSKRLNEAKKLLAQAANLPESSRFIEKWLKINWFTRGSHHNVRH